MELNIYMSNNESASEKSKRINGYFFPEYFDKYYAENKNLQIVSDEYFHDIKSGKYIENSRKFSIKIIDSLEKFIRVIDKFEYSYMNPILYRGHSNANYFNIPSVFRNHTEKENLLFNEFERKFPTELSNCRSTVEKLLFMQHYGLETRILDVTESPLVALYFACQEMLKFREKKDANKNKWGQVVAFRLNNTDKEDFRKFYSSKTVSVMSNTALLGSEFTLNDVEREYFNDNHFGDLKKSINLKDVISNSVYVRTKQDNPRIKNQQGGFFIVNANELIEINTSKNIPSEKYVMEYVINDNEGDELNLRELSVSSFNDKKIMRLKGLEPYNFKFKKIVPYSLDNKYERFQTDPFNLSRHLLKNEKGEQVLLLIPPYCKKRILKQLEKLNITESFIYPDIDSISYEINNRISEE